MPPPADATSAFALLPVPICVMRERRLVFANRAMERLLELPPGESLVGMHADALIARYLRPEDVAWARTAMAARTATEETPRASWFVLRGREGRLRTVATRDVPGPGPGEVTYVVYDLDETADAERLGKALAGAAAQMMRLREEVAVLECAVDAVFQQGLCAVVLRLEGDTLRVAAGRQQARFTRAEDDTAPRSATEERIPRAAVPELEALLVSRRAHFQEDMRAVAVRLHGERAVEALDAYGGEPQRGMAAPIFVEEQPYGFLSVQGPHLTPVGAAELELFAQSVGAALENVRHHRRAREQLDELARLQGELVRQARLAVLGEAAAVVAHEVRNPLAVILNAVTLLRRDQGLGPRSAQMVQTVDEEARRLDALVRDLLDVTRPLEPRRLPVDLGALVQRAVSQLPAAAGRVTVEVAPEVPVVEVDGHLLQLALENLLRNAVEAGPDREPVRVRVLTHPEGVALTVEDRGPGVPSQDRDRIFEPFFTTRAEGTGLGLTLVKRVADAHGARVCVDDREGGGARFTLVVPRP